MDVIEAALRGMGAFYTFAGYVATRASLTSLCLDHALAAIGGKKLSRIEVAQSLWLLVAATVVLAGGAALILLLHIAVWLFLVSAVGQAVYLLALAPRIFDVADAPSPSGRRQSQNAFSIYLLASAIVVWAARDQRLLDWPDVPGPLLVVAALGMTAHVAYVVWTVVGMSALSRAPIAPLLAEPPDRDEGPQEACCDPAQSRAVKVRAGYETHPLWAMDDDLYGDFPPERLGLSPDLTRSLNAWSEAFAASRCAHDPARARWSIDEARAHASAGQALAARLACERPDLRIYVEDGDNGVVEVTGRRDDGGKRADPTTE